jgi:TRAP-type C4-dicarboxylate transport system substrate-binding protein
MNQTPRSLNRLAMLSSALVAAAIMAVFAGTASAQPTEPVVLRYSTSAPEKSAFSAQFMRLAQAVSEETGGSVRLDIYYGSQLANDRDAVQQVARGRIDMTGANITNWSALVPELQLLMLPMYFRSAAEMDCTLDGSLAQEVARRLQARGVRMLRWGDGSTMEMFGKKAYTSPGDLAGLKGGAYGSRLGVLMWQALDARPTPVSTPELATALQTGLIDVTVTVPIYYVALGLNKIAPVMTRLDLYFSSSVNGHQPGQLGAADAGAARRHGACLPAHARGAELDRNTRGAAARLRPACGRRRPARRRHARAARGFPQGVRTRLAAGGPRERTRRTVVLRCAAGGAQGPVSAEPRRPCRACPRREQSGAD